MLTHSILCCAHMHLCTQLLLFLRSSREGKVLQGLSAVGRNVLRKQILGGSSASDVSLHWELQAGGGSHRRRDLPHYSQPGGKSHGSGAGENQGVRPESWMTPSVVGRGRKIGKFKGGR